jgi:hypothetical protein
VWWADLPQTVWPAAGGPTAGVGLLPLKSLPVQVWWVVSLGICLNAGLWDTLPGTQCVIEPARKCACKRLNLSMSTAAPGWASVGRLLETLSPPQAVVQWSWVVESCNADSGSAWGVVVCPAVLPATTGTPQCPGCCHAVAGTVSVRKLVDPSTRVRFALQSRPLLQG